MTVGCPEKMIQISDMANAIKPCASRLNWTSRMMHMVVGHVVSFEALFVVVKEKF